MGRWLREEAFWKDVTSQALGGIVVLGVAFILAGAAGVLPVADIQAAVLFGIIATALFIAGVAVTVRLMPLAERFIKPLEPKLWLAIPAIFIAYTLAFLPMMGLWFLIYPLYNWLLG